MLKDALGMDVVGAIRVLMAATRVIPPEVSARLADFTTRRDLTESETEGEAYRTS